MIAGVGLAWGKGGGVGVMVCGEGEGDFTACEREQEKRVGEKWRLGKVVDILRGK